LKTRRIKEVKVFDTEDADRYDDKGGYISVTEDTVGFNPCHSGSKGVCKVRIFDTDESDQFIAVVSVPSVKESFCGWGVALREHPPLLG
jgi:hypothetical protein